MTSRSEGLQALQDAEALADRVWRRVTRWDEFARDVVGKQLARAVDSVGANITGACNRFNDEEKLQFLYAAHGSLFETKYWLNRTHTRGLLPSAQVQDFASQLTELASQLNIFTAKLKLQRHSSRKPPETMREPPTQYTTDQLTDTPTPLFTDEELEYLITCTARKRK